MDPRPHQRHIANPANRFDFHWNRCSNPEGALQNKDKQTANFLQWYLDEQHEEEVLYRNLLDRIRLIGLQDRGLYFIDKEVEDLYSQKQATEKKKSKGAE